MAEPLQLLRPDFLVRIGGKDLPVEASADLLGVTVEDDVEAPSMFSFSLHNWDQSAKDVKWSDDALFGEGGEVAILMGYGDSLDPLITGDITGIEPEFSSGGLAILTVRGYDRRHRLQRVRKTRSFTQVKDSDLASQLANEAGLTAQVKDSGAIHDYLLQSNQSDLEFLEQRARRIGYEIAADGKTLYFRPRGNAEKEALTLDVADDLVEFRPQLSALWQFSSMDVRGWDAANQEALTASASDGDQQGSMADTAGPAAARKAFGAAPATIVDRPVRNQHEADSLARGVFNEMALDYITGEGVAVGRTDLRAGIVVRITGAGKRFGGPYYITATQHSWTTNEGYRTLFQFRRSAS